MHLAGVDLDDARAGQSVLSQPQGGGQGRATISQQEKTPQYLELEWGGHQYKIYTVAFWKKKKKRADREVHNKGGTWYMSIRIRDAYLIQIRCFD